MWISAYSDGSSVDSNAGVRLELSRKQNQWTKEQFLSFLLCKDPIPPPDLSRKLWKYKIKGKRQPFSCRKQQPKSAKDRYPKPPYSGEVSRNCHSLICFKGFCVFMFIVFFFF